MTKKPDGGPAYPTTPDHQVRMSGVGGAGMTLRDYFAAQALTSFTARWGDMEGPALGGIAKRSYEMADAMIAARDK